MDVTTAAKFIQAIFRKHLKGLATDIGAEESNFGDGSIHCSFFSPDVLGGTYSELHFQLKGSTVTVFFTNTEGLTQLTFRGWSDATITSNELSVDRMVRHLDTLAERLGKLPGVDEKGYRAYKRLVGVRNALAEIARHIQK